MYEMTGWAQVLQVPTSLIPPGADMTVYFMIRTAPQQRLHQTFSTVRPRNAGDSADHCRSAEKSTEVSDTSYPSWRPSIMPPTEIRRPGISKGLRHVDADVVG